MRRLLPLLLLIACRSGEEDQGQPDAAIGDSSIDAIDTSTPETPSPTHGCDKEPTSPIEYGKCVLETAIKEEKLDAPAYQIAVDKTAAPESFGIQVADGVVRVTGGDDVGAMYGAMELAERVRMHVPFATATTQKPFAKLRGSNFFAVLPTNGETMDTWWFHDMSFWREYLDMLVRARFNELAFHGLYNVEDTVFPNALLFFATSKSFPMVGRPAAERAKNLATFKAVMEMCRIRGIKVTMVSYRALLDDRIGGPTPTLTDEELKTYTREAVQDLATNLPGLWRIGFRIGESGYEAAWYKDTFITGVKAAGASIKLETRAWLSSKSQILELAALTDDLLISTKYNGEHIGPPWMNQGSAMETPAQPSYTYEDYLEDPQPYTVITQIWADGPHRYLRWANFDHIRRVSETYAISPRLGGFMLQPGHSYDAPRDPFHTNVMDRYSPWTFRRDELQYLMFGRLGYDPKTSIDVFKYALRARVGTDALWEPMQAANEIVPWILASRTCGADTRDNTPDLEWGGDVAFWARPRTWPSYPCGIPGPFATFDVASAGETADDILAGRPTAKISTLDLAARMLEWSKRASAAATVEQKNAEARDVARTCLALAKLGEYTAHKMIGATALAVYGSSAKDDWLAVARKETDTADAAWRDLASQTTWLAPLKDHLRMIHIGLPEAHYSDQLKWLPQDPAAIDKIVASKPKPSTAPDAATTLAYVKPKAPAFDKIEISPLDPKAVSWTVTVRFAEAPPTGATVKVHWKSFEGAAFWETPVAATAIDGKTFTATITGTRRGALFAAELTTTNAAYRFPDPFVTQPYVALPP
jgi:hypothetical protein